MLAQMEKRWGRWKKGVERGGAWLRVGKDIRLCDKYNSLLHGYHPSFRLLQTNRLLQTGCHVRDLHSVV